MNEVLTLSIASVMAALLAGCGTAPVQAPAPPPAATIAAVPSPPAVVPNPGPVDAASLPSLAWLHGCWAGTVNQRDFREQWSPLRGGMLVGAGHTVNQGKTQSFEFLRIEARGDGIYYVAKPSGQPEAAFKLESIAMDDKDAIFLFVNEAHDFPQRIIYRRGSEGWLYATIEGKLNGQDRQVIFPMRRVDCENGEFIRN
jgi:Domain of unknown function (DUF6265)